MKTQKTKMRGAALALIILAMTLITGVAKGNTITTFDVFGTFTTPYSGTFGGTLTVDVTNGTVSSVHLIFPGLADFNFIVQSNPWPAPPGWILAVGNSTLDALDLTFTRCSASMAAQLPVGTFLTYKPSRLCSYTSLAPSHQQQSPTRLLLLSFSPWVPVDSSPCVDAPVGHDRPVRPDRFRARACGMGQRGNGKRYVVRADEKLTAFIELELAIHARNG